MMVGPLMHDYRTFQIPYAGGCKLGTRTVAPHLYALEPFGVEIVATQGHYNIQVKKQAAGRVALYESGDTVTENILLAAARTPEETIIEFASANYMVQDVAFFLRKLGVKIDGIGTSTLRVRGLKNIRKNITYAPSEDPVEAMTFIATAITTNSSITIKRAPIDDGVLAFDAVPARTGDEALTGT
jgi:UDP-N-acetylglucosamine 1-carboxyvinyltransferase